MSNTSKGTEWKERERDLFWNSEIEIIWLKHFCSLYLFIYLFIAQWEKSLFYLFFFVIVTIHPHPETELISETVELILFGKDHMS